jgi:primosomal protein N' (replication factor Y)
MSALTDIAARFPQAARHLKRLETLGRVQCEHRAHALVDPYANFPSPPAPDPKSLTDEQRMAVTTLRKAVDERRGSAFLLQGVTGSGKTEVYLQTLAHVRAQGRTALILVPEIALTPALAARFRGRVAGGVAVLHSGLSGAERLAAYDAARHGRVGAVLGARSAVFAPLWNVGLVVVDEEHDGSYKQDETPRYNGRDLAIFRARAAQSLCILGSATPSLESVHGVQSGRLHELRLTTRPGTRPMPVVEVVDLRQKRGSPGTQRTLTAGAEVTILTPRLLEALAETLARREQALIFLNRRGYSSALLCVDCGHSLQCPHCAVSLTHHVLGHSPTRRAPHPGGLQCHYCDHHQSVPETCPNCAGYTLRPLGLGIQRVETEVAAQFPSARIGRLDRDSVRRKGALEQTLTAFAQGELDVLVGTQMLAKGHDYPGVTLVGVVTADVGLRIPDWRASERTFQLLVQVAGRAGRGNQPGRVIIQTFCPEHDALRCAVSHDISSFHAREMLLRKELSYPPYARLALIRTESALESEASRAAQRASDVLRQEAARHGDAVSVLGPAPAPLARLKGIWRYQVLLKSSSHAARAAVMAPLQRELGHGGSAVRIILDVDPGDML